MDREYSLEELDALDNSPGQHGASGSWEEPQKEYSLDELDALNRGQHGATGEWKEPPGVGETMLRHAAQGATAGFANKGLAASMALQNYQKGGRDLLDEYRRIRDEQVARTEEGYRAHPYPANIASVGGAVASNFIPVIGPLMNVGKEAGLAANIVKPAVTGGLYGLGESKADLTKGEFGQAAADTLKGAAAGFGTHALARGPNISSSIAKNAAPAVGAVFLNTPMEMTKKYMGYEKGAREAGTQNPVLSAERGYELARDFQENGLEKLRKMRNEGSEQSKELLDAEGTTVPRSEIANIYRSKADEINRKAEGTITNDKELAAYKALLDQASKIEKPKIVTIEKPIEYDYQNYIPTRNDPKVENITQEIERDPFSLRRVKKEVQSFDDNKNWEVRPGVNADIDKLVKRDVRRNVDQKLKFMSPAYANHMEEVASDTRLLKKASELAKSEKNWTNIFKRLETDKFGTGQIPRDTLEEFDKRLSSNYLKRGELSHLREAFDKSVTSGSMNVNKFSYFLKGIPGIRVVAPLIGVGVDKWGRKGAQKMVEKAVDVNIALDKYGVTGFVNAVKPIYDLSKEGNAAAIGTIEMLHMSNPEEMKNFE